MDLLGQDLVGSSAPLGHWRGHTVATWTWRRRATGFQCASLVFQLFAGSELFRDVEGLRSKTQLRFSRSADVPGTGHDTQKISAGHLHQTTPEVKNRTTSLCYRKPVCGTSMKDRSPRTWKGSSIRVQSPDSRRTSRMVDGRKSGFLRHPHRPPPTPIPFAIFAYAWRNSSSFHSTNIDFYIQECI